MDIVIIGVVILLVMGIIGGILETRQQKNNRLFGESNGAMICPHCQSRGTVHTKAITRKKGISGGKATAAIFTGGVSMLATGLSRKEKATQVYCSNCMNTWFL